MEKIFFEEFFVELARNKVKYLIVGGAAALIHGVVRLTADLDLIIDMEEGNTKRFGKSIKRFGYTWRILVSFEDLLKPGNIKSWIKEKNLKAINFYDKKSGLKTVDLIVDLPFDFKRVYKNKKVVSIRKGLSLKVIAVRDLIKMKQKAARPQDLFDIDALTRLEGIEKN